MANVTPAVVNTEFDEIGSQVVGVGYGWSGPSDKIDSVILRHEKIAGENVIDSLDGYKLNGQSTLVLCDFDSPSDERYNKMGTAIAQNLEYMPYAGDSGGGLFRKTSRGWMLIGICEGGTTGEEMFAIMRNHNFYGIHGEWIRVSAFAHWIMDSIK